MNKRRRRKAQRSVSEIMSTGVLSVLITLCFYNTSGCWSRGAQKGNRSGEGMMGGKGSPTQATAVIAALEGRHECLS